MQSYEKYQYELLGKLSFGACLLRNLCCYLTINALATEAP